LISHNSLDYLQQDVNLSSSTGSSRAVADDIRLASAL